MTNVHQTDSFIKPAEMSSCHSEARRSGSQGPLFALFSMYPAQDKMLTGK